MEASLVLSSLAFVFSFAAYLYVRKSVLFDLKLKLRSKLNEFRAKSQSLNHLFTLEDQQLVLIMEKSKGEQWVRNWQQTYNADRELVDERNRRFEVIRVVRAKDLNPYELESRMNEVDSMIQDFKALLDRYSISVHERTKLYMQLNSVTCSG